MKKAISTIVFISVSIVLLKLLLTLVGGSLIGGAFSPAFNKKSMEKDFQKNKEAIVVVKDYMANSNYNELYISPSMTNGKISISGETTKITDTNVVKAINKLKSRGYHVIVKDNNTIYFQRWSNLDNGRGIAYSITDDLPELQFLTKLEPLSEVHWYYYEEDFNEWKKRNQN